jgi:putative hydrolase of the HAD superfamily
MTTVRWKAVVFDIDDTLYPEHQFVVSGFTAVSAWIEECLGIPQAETLEELCGAFQSGVQANSFDHWAAGRLVPKDIVPRMVEVYRGHSPTLQLFPGVRDLLDRLHRRFRLGIVSDGYLEVQKRKLAALRVEQQFDAVVFSDQWGQSAWKPSTVPFEQVLSRLGVTGAESVYVADNVAKDFVGARELGMATVQACWGSGVYSSAQPPDRRYAPDHVAATPRDLESLLVRPEPTSS